MTYTPIPRGTEPWDEQVNNAFTDQDIRITANADNLTILSGRVDSDQDELSGIQRTGVASSSILPIKYQNFPAEFAFSATSIGPGNICMMRIDIPVTTTVTNVVLVSSGAGAALTADQNFAGIYDSAGSRIGVTADQSTNWLTTGLKEMPLTAPLVLEPGSYYVSVVSNGTTRPSFIRAYSSADAALAVNYGLSPSTYRYAFGLLGQPSLPTTIDMAARTNLSVGYWAALT